MSVEFSDAELKLAHEFIELAEEVASKKLETSNPAAIASIANLLATIATGNTISRETSRSVDVLEQLLLKGSD